jgi:hypothetical protein
MGIRRDDIDARKVDFSAVHSGRRLPAVHPGEILRDEFLTPVGVSVYDARERNQGSPLPSQ